MIRKRLCPYYLKTPSILPITHRLSRADPYNNTPPKHQQTTIDKLQSIKISKKVVILWTKRRARSILHRRNPTSVRHLCAQRCMWQRKRAQRCDSDGADGNVTALTVTGGCDSDVYISVTAMATDTAVTAVTTDSAVSVVTADTAVTAIDTLVWQRWQLTVM